MKKVFFILGLSFLLGSCATTGELIYVDENGECYPTLENIQKMTNMSTKNGVRYYWYQCDWYTWEQRDSLSAIESDRIMDKLIKMYDTINSKQIQ